MDIRQQKILIAELGGKSYEAAFAERNFAAVADALNARATIANPVAQTQTPVQFTWNTFLALLTPAEVLGLYGYGSLAADMRQALLDNDRVELAALWRAVRTVMIADTVTKVTTEFAKKEPDPTWQPTVLEPSRAMALGLPVVTAQDVETAWQKIAGE